MKEFSILFPFFFVGIFLLVIYFLSRKGWSALINQYRFYGDFSGERVGISSANINGVNYNNCLLFKINQQGVFIRPILFFRLFHPPVFIPWHDIKTVRDKKILFIKLKELVIGDPTVAIIQLKESIAKKLIYLK